MIEETVKRGHEIQREVRKQVAASITAGLGVVAGLAWNDAIRSFIDAIFPLDSSGGLIAKFIYALLMTLFIVFVSMAVLRHLVADEKKAEAEAKAGEKKQ